MRRPGGREMPAKGSAARTRRRPGTGEVAQDVPAALRGRVCAAIRADALLQPGDRVVVAVSGGSDSMALLALLAELRGRMRLRLTAAHVDHQLREGSTEDARFVESHSRSLGVPVVIERRDVAAACARRGWSIEEGARHVRYDALTAVAVRVSAAAIAVAHTADDQAETVLMRLLRGAGPAGLAAMSPRRPATASADAPAVIRPLLGVWRRELTEYLRARAVPWREDPSNTDRRFLRNRIRHDLLPLLEREYRPNIRAALAQLASQCRAETELVEAALDRQWSRIARPDQRGGYRLRLAAFRRQP
ncbi:MAG TPA: tRNA lysidine(34) synthetase TilS, partial [bacterium]